MAPFGRCRLGTDWLVKVASEDHARALAANMRAADAAEVRASGGYDPLEAVLASLRSSDRAWTLIVGGEVAAIWGTCPAPCREAGTAVVWLLTSAKVATVPRPFCRLAGRVLAGLLRRHGVLVNAIDCRYGAAVRWARHLGAEVQAPISFGVEGRPFHPVVFRRGA